MRFIKSYSVKTALNIVLCSLFAVGFVVIMNTAVFYKAILYRYQEELGLISDQLDWIISEQLMVFTVSSIFISLISLAVSKKTLKPLKELEKNIAGIKDSYKGVDNTQVLLSESGYDEFKSLSVTINELIKTVLNYKDENKLLSIEAITDPLTGLYNTRYLNAQLDKIFKEPSESITALFIDIDKFKEVNDKFGHAIGDIVLKEISQIIIKRVKEVSETYNTVTARYGGEELVIILDNCPRQKGYEISEAIRNDVFNSKILMAVLDNTRVSISSGVASFPSDAINQADLLVKADVALYFSKKSGRNKSTLYRSELEFV